MPVQTNLFVELSDLPIDRNLHYEDSLSANADVQMLTMRDRSPQLDFLAVAYGTCEQRGATRVEVRELQVHLCQAVLIR
jgi:hypothetical protein